MKKVTPQNHATTANINKRIKFPTSQKMTKKFILSRTYEELRRQKIHRKMTIQKFVLTLLSLHILCCGNVFRNRNSRGNSFCATYSPMLHLKLDIPGIL